MGLPYATLSEIMTLSPFSARSVILRTKSWMSWSILGSQAFFNPPMVHCNGNCLAVCLELQSFRGGYLRASKRFPQCPMLVSIDGREQVRRPQRSGSVKRSFCIELRVPIYLFDSSGLWEEQQSRCYADWLVGLTGEQWSVMEHVAIFLVGKPTSVTFR